MPPHIDALFINAWHQRRRAVNAAHPPGGQQGGQRRSGAGVTYNGDL